MRPEAEKETLDYEAITRQHYQDAAVARAYFDAYAGRFRLRSLPARVIALQERRYVKAALAQCQPSPKTILDVPCGTGKSATVLAESQATCIIGGDVSTQMMEFAKQAYGLFKSFHGLVQCDATQLPFQDASFDAVICLRLLHRTPDQIRRQIIAELVRVSRHYVIVSYGLVDRWHRFRLRLRNLVTGGVTVPYPITFEAAAKDLQASGLEVISRYPVMPFLSSQTLILLRKQVAKEK